MNPRKKIGGEKEKMNEAEKIQKKILECIVIWETKAIEVAEQFTNGEATRGELDAARAAAWDDAWTAQAKGLINYLEEVENE